MSTSSAELLTKDKASPLLKKPDAVILVVDLFNCVAVKVAQGEIQHTAIARGVSQKENAQNALQLLREEAKRLSQDLIVVSHEAVLTTVPVTFSADTSWLDANQALVWQLNEILTDIFPTPKTAQVIETTSFLDGEKLEKWKQFLSSNPEPGNVEQALTTLGLASEAELDSIHRQLEKIAPQSLEQLHLGWRPMAGEETAVIAIRKELRQAWLAFGKKNKLKLKAVLPLTMPGEEEMKGGKGHFTKISPAKVSTYYFEKGLLHEVRDYPRQTTLLPESWVLGLNTPGEAEQRIFCSKQDAALLARYLPEDTPLTMPLVLTGENRTEEIIKNVLHFAVLPPQERSLPFISPLEPLPPLSKRRLPYYGSAAAIGILAAGLMIKPALDEKRQLTAALADKSKNLAFQGSEIARLQGEKKAVTEAKSKIIVLQRALAEGSEGPKVRGKLSRFSSAAHQKEVLYQMAQNFNDQIQIESYQANAEGAINLIGSAPSRQVLTSFASPFLQSLEAMRMPPHVLLFNFDQPTFSYQYVIKAK